MSGVDWKLLVGVRERQKTAAMGVVARDRAAAEQSHAELRQAEAWQRHFRAERGETFLHLGDEFYLMCGEPVPPAVTLSAPCGLSSCLMIPGASCAGSGIAARPCALAVLRGVRW